MIAVSPHGNVEIKISNFTTIQSISEYCKYSLYNKNNGKLLIDNIGKEPVRIHCVNNLEFVGELIRITDSHDNVEDYILYASPNDFVKYSGVGVGLAGIAGLSMALLHLTRSRK